MSHWTRSAAELTLDADAILRIQAILDAAVNAIITIDEKGIIDLFNPAAEGMFGYAAAEVIGGPVTVLMTEPEASRHDSYIRRYIETREARVIGIGRETNARRRDGTIFPIELALSATIVGGRWVFAAFIRDVSQRKNAERELQMHRLKLEEMVAARTAELEAANRQLSEADARLRSANHELARLVRVHELTGIGNRRAFDETLKHESRRCRRTGEPWSLIMSDVDFFKRYNDHYGHAAGDRALVAVAEALKDTFRRVTDFPARYGGEEFAAILSGSDAKTAWARAETLRQCVHDLAIEHAALGPGRGLTVSIGVATWEPAATAVASNCVVEAADRALYRAKSGGRDRIEVEPVDGPGDASARPARIGA